MKYKPEDVKLFINGEEVIEFRGNPNITLEKAHVPKPKAERVKTEQFEVHYDVIGAGPVGHPQEIFRKIAKEQRFDILESTPHTIGDCWIFKVQFYNDTLDAYWPSYTTVRRN